MIRNMALYIAVALIFVTLSLTEAQQPNYGSCTTAFGSDGLCVHMMTQCPSIRNIVRESMRNSEYANRYRNFIQSSLCGTNNGKTLVCCPQSTHLPNTRVKVSVALPEPGVCGIVPPEDHIFGGNETKIDEHPWMALIEYRKNNKNSGHHCGGSLITERYVLTAAHCVKQIPDGWDPIRVRLGEWDTSTRSDCQRDIRGPKYDFCADAHLDVDIEKTIVHENYNVNSRNQFNDIALIRLSRSVTFTDFIQPICLPTKSHLKEATYEGEYMDAVGWGLTENGIKSTIKLKATLPVVPLNECRRTYGKYSNIQDGQICAGGLMGIDTCKGDSGGPLIELDTSDRNNLYYYIAGVTSYGPTPCGQLNFPGVFTKVSRYVAWIEENLEH